MSLEKIIHHATINIDYHSFVIEQGDIRQTVYNSAYYIYRIYLLKVDECFSLGRSSCFTFDDIVAKRISEDEISITFMYRSGEKTVYTFDNIYWKILVCDSLQYMSGSEMAILLDKKYR